MNKYLKLKMHICIFILILVVFLFPICKVYAEKVTGSDGKEYTYSEIYDGTDGPDVTNVIFELNGNSGKVSLDEYKGDELEVDEFSKYGWKVYKKDEFKFVAITAATHEFLNKYMINKASLGLEFNEYPYKQNYIRKYDHIHYFHIGDIVEFSFENREFDSNVYTGIILGTCEAATFPQDANWNYGRDVNVIDIYFGKETADKERLKKSNISGKRINISLNGKFTSKVDMKKKSILQMVLILLKKGILFLGDFLESLIGMSFSNVQYIEPGVYKQEMAKKINELKITNYGETSDAKFLSTHDVSNARRTKFGAYEVIYSINSGIPIVQYDVYAMLSQNLDLFDIDFINTNSANTNKCWIIIRNIVFVCSRAILYLSAAAFITILIWQGIVFVTSIYKDSPLKATDAKKTIQNCVITIIRLIGIFLIISLTINLYKAVKSQILGEYTSIYLVRINIQNVYSFNTNTIGSIRLMTVSQNIYQALFWAIIYFISAIINLFFYVLMFFRTIAIGMLVIIAPITAVTGLLETEKDVINNKNIFQFNGWIKVFLLIVWIPMLLLIISRILLMV